MLLSNADLAAISKALGRTHGALVAKIDRVTGPEYNKTEVELEHVTDLLARIQAEEMQRRRRSA